MKNKIMLWTLISVLLNAALMYAIFTSTQQVMELKRMNSELRIDNNKLVSDGMRCASEINRLNELIEFHKQLNGVQ